MWRVALVLIVAFGGFWFGKTSLATSGVPSRFPAAKEYPIAEHKSFAIVIYAYNQALWCERALQSVFEQDYDHYRLIVIDDGSTDGTAERVREFIADNNQDQKVIFVRNETRLGPGVCLSRALDSCLDREIVIPLEGKDWLSSPLTLTRLNAAYQNPNTWMTLAPVIDYPSYEIRPASQVSYYAVLFKQTPVPDGDFVPHLTAYLTALLQKAEGKVFQLEEPIAFSNRS